MKIYLVFKNGHKGEFFITPFSEEKIAKKFVEQANEKGGNPFCGFFYEEKELDEFVIPFKEGVKFFTIVLDKDGNKVCSRISCNVPCSILEDEYHNPFITKVSLTHNYLGMYDEKVKDEDFHVFYLTHQCLAKSEEEALQLALEKKKDLDAAGIWGQDDYYKFTDDWEEE